MKITITKITSFLMALLVLISTFSLTIEKHFCGDFLVDISYFGNSSDCCAQELKKSTCDTSLEQEKEKCCTDQIQQIEGQDDVNITSIEKITLKHFVLAFAITYNGLFVNLKKQIVPHKYYSPPNLITDIQVLHEVFIV